MLHHNQDVSDRDSQVAPAGPAAAGSPVRVPRVLFADDAVAARVLMASLLRRMNLMVDVAEDGEEVLALVDRFSYDLVLLDIDMPVMDGVETARQIRRIERGLKRTPIIAVSGYLNEFSRRKNRQGDFDGVVSKPVTLSRLWTAMAQMLPDGHACVEHSSLLRVARTQLPLIDHPARCDTETGDAPFSGLVAPVHRLRQLTAELQHSLNDGPTAVLTAARELDRLAVRLGAPRLQRAAAVLAALAAQSSGDELQARTGEVIACAVATMNELKKLASESV